MERKLVTIENVEDVWCHPNADLLDLVRVRGWQCVVKKGEFKKGDKVIYFEIDSFLPIREEFEFLRASSFRKMGETEGFRLRSIRLRKEISQGLVLPISLLNGVEGVQGEIGEDVTEKLNVQKWEPPIPTQLQGVIKGNFPSWISKTDQERVQNIWRNIESFEKTIEFEVTEKLDGSSVTIGKRDEELVVCSRNLSLKLGEENDNNSFVRCAKNNNYLTALEKYSQNVAVQGELCGPGIQGNPYNLSENRMFVFDVWLVDEGRYADRYERLNVLDDLRELGANVEEIPVLNFRFLPDTLDVMLNLAEGKSVLNSKVEREGIVWKSMTPINGHIFSFKAISNRFLIGQKD